MRPSTLAVSLVAIAAAGPACAFEPSGTKRVVVQMHDGKDVQVGTVTFTPEGDGASYRLDVDTKPFKEFFLSMRPFKCLDGSDVWCYVPYPYDHPHVVTAKDYSWLEHDLLFLSLIHI